MICVLIHIYISSHMKILNILSGTCILRNIANTERIFVKISFYPNQ
jgi:hypothetical protein